MHPIAHFVLLVENGRLMKKAFGPPEGKFPGYIWAVLNVELVGCQFLYIPGQTGTLGNVKQQPWSTNAECLVSFVVSNICGCCESRVLR